MANIVHYVKANNQEAWIYSRIMESVFYVQSQCLLNHFDVNGIKPVHEG